WVGPRAGSTARNWTPCSCLPACCAGLGALPPFGVYFRHAFIAFWNAGEFGLIPLAVMLPLAEGSGKLGTPFCRMHDANFVRSFPPAIVKLTRPPPPPFDVPPPEEGAAAEEFVVVDPPEPATLGEPPVPPPAGAGAGSNWPP